MASRESNSRVAVGKQIFLFCIRNNSSKTNPQSCAEAGTEQGIGWEITFDKQVGFALGNEIDELRRMLILEKGWITQYGGQALTLDRQLSAAQSLTGIMMPEPSNGLGNWPEPQLEQLCTESKRALNYLGCWTHWKPSTQTIGEA